MDGLGEGEGHYEVHHLADEKLTHFDQAGSVLAADMGGIREALKDLPKATLSDPRIAEVRAAVKTFK